MIYAVILKSDHFGIETWTTRFSDYNVQLLKSDHFGIETNKGSSS